MDRRGKISSEQAPFNGQGRAMNAAEFCHACAESIGNAARSMSEHVPVSAAAVLACCACSCACCDEEGASGWSLEPPMSEKPAFETTGVRK